jgi:hypothetical protein
MVAADKNILHMLHQLLRYKYPRIAMILVIPMLLFLLGSIPNKVFGFSGEKPHWEWVEETPIVKDSLGPCSFINSNDGWAVGRGQFLHWNGKNWDMVPIPNPTDHTKYFSDVEMISPDYVWFIGQSGTLYFWDGHTFTRAVYPGYTISSDSLLLQRILVSQAEGVSSRIQKITDLTRKLEWF